MNDFNESQQINNNFTQLKYFKKYKKKKLLEFFIYFLIFILFEFILYITLIKTRLERIKKENNLEKNDMELDMDKVKIMIEENKLIFGNLTNKLKYEAEMPHLNEILKKRTFEKRVPLPNAIKCKPHLINEELTAFLSFLIYI